MKRKNIVLIISLVVLSLLVVGLGSFIIYDKILSDDEIEVNNKEYQYNLTKRTNIQAISEGYIKIFVDTEGNAYLNLIGNINYIDNDNLKNNLLKLQKSFENYSPKDYISYGNEKILNAYKLDIEKILTVYFVHMGNDDSSYFIFIKENGTLSYLDYGSIIYNGEINLKDINNLDNIVSVVENAYTMTPYAINLNGDEISLYDYIK